MFCFCRSLRSASCYGLKGCSTKRVPRTFADARRMCSPRTRHISDEVVSLSTDSSDKKSKMSSSAITIPSTPTYFDEVSSSVGCYPILGQFLLCCPSLGQFLRCCSGSLLVLLSYSGSLLALSYSWSLLALMSYSGSVLVQFHCFLSLSLIHI